MLMTNNTSAINTEIKVNGQKIATVTSFKYQGSVLIDEGSKPEILSRIAQTTTALARLKPVWNDRSISLSSKTQLMCSLVTSICDDLDKVCADVVLLHGCPQSCGPNPVEGLPEVFLKSW